ncbi:MAG: ABC transporter substrate-binding protein [Angelakisella sp.]
MNRPLRWRVAGILTVLTVLSAGCAPTGKNPPTVSSSGSTSQSSAPLEYPVTVNDVTIEAAPKAVISLAPAATELLFGMGYQSRVMGISNYCDYPPEADEKLRCGSALVPDKKAISLRPVDLVVTTSPLTESDLIWFQQKDVPVLMLPRATTLEALWANYLTLATAMGGASSGKACGEHYCATLQKKLDEAVALGKAYSQSHDPLVAILLREMSYGMATGDTLEGKLLELLGFQNDAAAYTDWRYPEAQVKALEPEVIFCHSDISLDELAASWTYKPVKAVRNHKLMNVDFTVFERQSPRMFDTLLAMAEFGYSQ